MACLAKKEQVANKFKLSPDVNLREELMKLKMQSQKDSDRIFELEKKTKNLKENEKSQRKRKISKKIGWKSRRALKNSN